MAQWFVAYCPSVEWAYNDPSMQREMPRFRVHSAEEPERWIVETNADLPRDMQEDIALLIADRLSKIFEP